MCLKQSVNNILVCDLPLVLLASPAHRAIHSLNVLVCALPLVLCDSRTRRDIALLISLQYSIPAHHDSALPLVPARNDRIDICGTLLLCVAPP